MAMVINTNLSSINAQRQLSHTNSSLQTSMERLSSGLRVNSAKDDAAGLAVADGMTSQIRGMTVAVRNANDGISMAQTAESALGTITDTLQRMRDLAVQARNFGAVSSSDREKLSTEFKQLQKEITRVTANTEFNGKKILAGSLKGANFQVGAGIENNNQISITMSVGAAKVASFTGMISALSTATSIGSKADSGAVSKAISAIDSAIKSIGTARSTLGAAQNRFTMTISNLQSSIENQSAARSRITDADFAQETSNMSRQNILQQAGTAMLAQANQSTQSVLSLLR